MDVFGRLSLKDIIYNKKNNNHNPNYFFNFMQALRLTKYAKGKSSVKFMRNARTFSGHLPIISL